jgi:hypothetical protein
MPEISRFYGIVIKMFFADHNPPHFHVQYNDFAVIIEIDTLSIIQGKLPPRALGLTMEWASIHQKELKEFWNAASRMEPIGKIKPLE